ncbi:hypothetical protein V5O48_002643 [Marasmius crinis-equi]|uniref:Uncharacterized protein n=1 Tax=Marasmius crinis-equi TaxID=585013 RepID=A0ABR3FV37_9AGAR
MDCKSVVGRYITYPVIDKRYLEGFTPSANLSLIAFVRLSASGSLNINMTRVQELGDAWQSETLTRFAEDLSENGSSVNAGQLVGHRHFYANDYTIHRGSDYISTLKMFSKRTKNAECVNSENPFGFHLADGTQYTYVVGNEYEDISAAWDWNLIPGITVDYGATPLSCDKTRFGGVEMFVGGVSNGATGVSAMRYTNPATKSLRFQKAWFFLNDVEYVMVSNISSSTGSEVYSVLDQRRHAGPIFINDEEVSLQQNVVTNFTTPTSLWHGGVGYTFEPNLAGVLSISIGPKTGDWSSISVSKQPPTTVDLYTAFIRHTSLDTPISYAVYPGTPSVEDFMEKNSSTQVRSIRNDPSISAVYDDTNDLAMMVFWDPQGGCVTQNTGSEEVTICSTANAAVIYDTAQSVVTISDPSQTLSSLELNFRFAESGQNKSLTFSLTQNGQAGGSVAMKL